MPLDGVFIGVIDGDDNDQGTSANASDTSGESSDEGHSSMPDPISSSAAKIATDLVKEEAKGYIDLTKKWIKSRNVMIVGQERAGKTNFYDYLVYNIKRPEEETPVTRNPVKSGIVTLKLTDSLQATVRNYIDLPGQSGPNDLADAVARQRPYLLLIFINLRRPLQPPPNDDGHHTSVNGWLTAILGRLGDLTRASKRTARKIRHIIIVLNKADVITDDGELIAIQQQVQKLMIQNLENSMGTRVRKFPVLPCCAVFDASNTRQSSDDRIKRVIQEVLIRLQKGRHYE